MNKKKQESEIKAIILDIGGVLELNKLGTYRNILTARHRCMGVHQEMAKILKISLDQWFDSIDTPYAKAIEGKISKSKFISIIAKNLKITPRRLERIWIRVYHKAFERNKWLFNIAFRLKKKGYKIAILSDQHHVSKEALLTKRDAKRFDVIIISCDVGMRKPNAKIYKLTLNKLKLKPKQTIFIDNQIWNITPAKKLGMKTILFKNDKQTVKELKKLGVE